ncbi:MAG: SDR family oxidoreductase, partial [Rhodospirillales bacterium]|nr:SDR family oxidoreductase [Rhodospirillales bacterium]
MSDENQLMKGKRGLVMGIANDHSIAWGIARTLAAQGAEMAFTFQGETLEKRVRPLAEKAGASLVMPCAVEDVASMEALFQTLDESWGSLDFLVHAIAF